MEIINFDFAITVINSRYSIPCNENNAWSIKMSSSLEKRDMKETLVTNLFYY